MKSIKYNPILSFRITMFIGLGLCVTVSIFKKYAPPIDRYSLCYMNQLFFLLINLAYIIYLSEKQKNNVTKTNFISDFINAFRVKKYVILLIISALYSIVLLSTLSENYAKILVLTLGEILFFLILLNLLSFKSVIYLFYINLFSLFLSISSAGLMTEKNIIVFYNPFGGLPIHLFF